MKYTCFILLILISACAKDIVSKYNSPLCINHKADYIYFKEKFNAEHNKICSNSCVYTSEMVKYSDTMNLAAGLYYLNNCDLQYGRL